MYRSIEAAYEYFREQILSDPYKPSRHLLEIHLSEEVGASYHTVIKALQKKDTHEEICSQKD